MAPFDSARASQCSAISSPPPMQTPLMAASVGMRRSRRRPKSSCPRRPASRAKAALAPSSSSTSAPAAKPKGFPVRSIPWKSPRSTSSSASASESSAARPKVGGCRGPPPLSIVTIASRPASGDSQLRT